MKRSVSRTMKPHSLRFFAVATLLCLASLAACTSTDAGMRAFVGQPSSELLARLGPPRLRAPGENGGQIWTYEEESRVMQPMSPIPGTLNSPSNIGSQTSALASPGFTTKREFYIDAGGTIYKYRGKGS